MFTRALVCHRRRIRFYPKRTLSEIPTIIHPRNQKILYYDCTNYYFEIEEESGLKHYGKSKEHRPNPIVGMGLFMDADGIPTCISIFSPAIRTSRQHLKPLEIKKS